MYTELGGCQLQQLRGRDVALENHQLVTYKLLHDVVLLLSKNAVHFRDLVQAAFADVQLVDGSDFVQGAHRIGAFLAVWTAAATFARNVILVHFSCHFAAQELMRVIRLPASIAGEEVLVGPALPVDIAPSDAVGFADEGNELFQIPRLIALVLAPGIGGSHVARASLAGLDLCLADRVELVAVDAFMKVVLRLLEEEFELDHEEAGYELVLAFLDPVQLLHWDSYRELANERCTDAAGIYLQLDDLGEFAHEKVNSIFNDRLEAKKLCGYQQRYDSPILDQWFCGLAIFGYLR